jgi:hypothetical protein
MKLLENLYAFKTVEYFGHKLIVPNWAKYLACDEDGTVCAYKNTPYSARRYWLDHDAENTEVIAIFSLERVDWKETLIEVE